MSFNTSMKPGESVKVGHTLITIVHTSKNRVDLAIDAPKSIEILKYELAGATNGKQNSK